MNAPGGKRKRITLDQKAAMIRAVESGTKKGNVARDFGISTSTLSTILSKQESIIDAVARGVKGSAMRVRAPAFEAVERAVFKWFLDTLAVNLPVSGALLQRKARDFACIMGYDNFVASSGWLQCFKERHDIVGRAAAWMSVTATTIANCFRHASFAAAPDASDEPSDEPTVPDGFATSDEVAASWTALCDAGVVPDSESFCDYVSADSEVVATEQLLDHDIVRAVSDRNETSDYDSVDEQETNVPTASEALDAVDVLRRYFGAPGGGEDDLNIAAVAERAMTQHQVQQVQQVAVSPSVSTTTAAGSAGQAQQAQQPMSGMAALAAAAAATQKMTTVTSTTAAASPTPAIRVVSPSVLAQQGLKLSTLPIQGSPTGTGTVRLAAPGTLLKAGTTVGGKQIITVHKGAAATSQPQIVTLVKTTQGVTLATMPKVSLIQQAGKASPQGKVIPQGATIVKLVTTQAGGTATKPTLITTSQAQQQPTLLGLAGATGASPKVTILRTLPSNIVTVAKPGSPSSVATVGSSPKQQQTIVIAAPKAGGQPGTAKLLTQAGAKAGPGGILVVTTHPQGKATVVGTASATVEAGKGEGEAGS
ncbi:hypothetical protein HPB51_016028 [Rhipicephalus microplus]|uniref:HTH CENPB-type domain-containing protein n=1 Tax=Rhipicephalus microplus TaxID=6941 RepID=A0A9J6DI39_RHIMP|nr:hypothetical protein HPB51_016028 [Rhipicephalus microplus]